MYDARATMHFSELCPAKYPNSKVMEQRGHHKAADRQQGQARKRNRPSEPTAKTSKKSSKIASSPLPPVVVQFGHWMQPRPLLPEVQSSSTEQNVRLADLKAKAKFHLLMSPKATA